MTDIRKWLLNNIDMKILALIMAIILWFYISSEYNIFSERYYEIEVKPVNLDPGLSIKEFREKISVGIQAQKKILENISSQKITGTVDLRGIKDAGEYQIGVDIVSPKNTNIVKVIPEEVEVVVEEIISKEYSIEYNLIGLPEKGYSLKDEPEIKPKEINITAADSIHEKIGQVKIDIDISSINESLTRVEKVIIYNKENEILDNLTIQPDTAFVSIQVGEGYPERILPIKPRIVGKPAPGYFVTKIEAVPNEVQIYGNYSKISHSEFLETIPIDVNGISKTLTVKVPPIIEEGIYLSEDQETLIEVQIQVEEREEERLFESITVEPRNASPFVNFQLNPNAVNVKVSGKYNQVNSITEEDIKVFIDLSNIEKEQDKVEIELPSGINLIQIIPEEIVISTKR